MKIFTKSNLAFLLLFFIGLSCEKNEESDKPGVEPDNTPAVLIEETIESTVNSSGGAIKLESGVEISIPPGALSSSTLIRISNINPFSVDENLVEQDTIDGLKLSSLVRCKPNGQTFAEPIKIMIPYISDLLGDESNTDSLIMIAVSENRVDTIEVEIDRTAHTATAYVSHFTDFYLKKKNGKWITSNEMIDKNDEGYLTFQFVSAKGTTYLNDYIKDVFTRVSLKLLQMKSCNVRLYKKKFLKDEFIKGIQIYTYLGWTHEDYLSSLVVKGGPNSRNKFIYTYDKMPGKKDREAIFDVTVVNKSHNSSVGLQIVEFNSNMEIENMDFVELIYHDEDFDLDAFNIDGQNQEVPILPLSHLESDENYYFIVEIIANGDVINDGRKDGKLVSTTFTLDDLGEPLSKNSKPAISIISPLDGESFFENETIIFSCDASDKEDEVLDKNQITWGSSLDGIIGQGQLLELSNLSIGSHTIIAKVEDTGGEKSWTRKEISITEQQGSIPITEFEAYPTIVNSGDLVQFTDLSTNNPDSWEWDFGDGGTSYSQNPSHTYNSAGSYTVELQASNSYGTNFKIITNYIDVSEGTEGNIIFQDNFNRTDNTEIGNGWFYGTGDFPQYSLTQIKDNELLIDIPTHCRNDLLQEINLQNYLSSDFIVIEYDFYMIKNSGADDCSSQFCLRENPTGKKWYLDDYLRFNIGLNQFNAGTDESTISHSIDFTTSHKIKIMLDNNSKLFNCYVDGTIVIEDAELPNGGVKIPKYIQITTGSYYNGGEFHYDNIKISTVN